MTWTVDLRINFSEMLNIFESNNLKGFEKLFFCDKN